MISGNILKMTSTLSNPVEYSLPLSDNELPMNQFIGREIELKFNGQINCIASNELIKKSYNSGYSYKSLMTLARCDLCIVKPELCHFKEGTCREPEWGEKYCNIPHIIYLSITDKAKVGITRGTQVPTRQIDQGASYFLPILEVKDRLTSGLIEKEISTCISDKTNWRAMLKNEMEDVDLYEIRDQIYEDFEELLDEYDANFLEDEEITQINFPVLEYPKKVSSLSFDKTPLIKGKLMGIKGQYLIFEHGVLNLRKHQGYFIEVL